MVEAPYIIHTKTQNLSFLKMYRYLKDKKVKNNKFFLRLYNKDLEDFNIRKSRITPELEYKILAEIAINPFYYIREIVLVSIPGGAINFDLHPGNLAILWAIFNNLDQICLLPRQQYKTQSIAAALSWTYFFGTKNTHMIFGNKSLNDAMNNLKRFKSIKDNLPNFLKKDTVAHKHDRDNLSFIESAQSKNRIDLLANPTNIEMADKMGRGVSVPIFWEDEFAFISYNDIILKASAPAYRKVADLAEAHGKPHCKILSTTPSDVDSYSGAVCKELIDDSAIFIEELYDWSMKRVREYIDVNGSSGYLSIKYTWQQLGLSEEWYAQSCKDLRYDTRSIKRELDIEWTKSSDNSVFEEAELDILAKGLYTDTKNLIVEITKEYQDDFKIERNQVPYMFKLFTESLNPNHPYFIGCDVSGGLGKDYSTIVIVDPFDNYKEKAIFKNNKINLSDFRLLIEQVVTNIIPKSTLFIENNSYGKGVIDELLKNTTVAKKLYFEYKVTDKDKTKRNPKTVTNSISYGINTNTASRELMIDILREVVIEQPHTIISQELVDDISGLIYNKTGKVEHDTHTHDDCIFGKLMVLYAVKYGNNISKFLRDINSIKRVNRNINSLNAHNAYGVVIDDPATNMGLNLDIADIMKRINAGDNVEDVIAQLSAGGTIAPAVNNTKLNAILAKK